MIDPVEAYRAATTRVGLIDRSDRARLEVSGPDRAKFLHNLTTNEIKRLGAGRGCEAFVTSPQGKTLGYVSLLVGNDRILVRADRDGLRLVRPHFEKYGMFDDIALDDVGGRTFEFHLAGPRSEDLARLLANFPELGAELDHATVSIEGCSGSVRVIRESPTGRPGVTLIGDRADATRVDGLVRDRGGSLGLVDLDHATFEVLRIEAGTPVFGLDVTEENLPQEVARDEHAINFVKGCYLGQETVARIDALGHVNKRLRGLMVSGEIPPPSGSAVEADGKMVGRVTSSAFSVGEGRPIALAYVRTSHDRPGTEVLVTFPDGSKSLAATVSDLPRLPSLDDRPNG